MIHYPMIHYPMIQIELSGEESTAITLLFQMIVDVMHEGRITPSIRAAVLLKLAAQNAQGFNLMNKEMFLQHAAAVWDLEQFSRPSSPDIH